MKLRQTIDIVSHDKDECTYNSIDLVYPMENIYLDFDKDLNCIDHVSIHIDDHIVLMGRYSMAVDFH
jgi:hypothetical protein